MRTGQCLRGRLESLRSAGRQTRKAAMSKDGSACRRALHLPKAIAAPADRSADNTRAHRRCAAQTNAADLRAADGRRDDPKRQLAEFSTATLRSISWARLCSSSTCATCRATIASSTVGVGISTAAKNRARVPAGLWAKAAETPCDRGVVNDETSPPAARMLSLADLASSCKSSRSVRCESPSPLAGSLATPPETHNCTATVPTKRSGRSWIRTPFGKLFHGGALGGTSGGGADRRFCVLAVARPFQRGVAKARAALIDQRCHGNRLWHARKKRHQQSLSSPDGLLYASRSVVPQSAQRRQTRKLTKDRAGKLWPLFCAKLWHRSSCPMTMNTLTSFRRRRPTPCR